MIEPAIQTLNKLDTTARLIQDAHLAVIFTGAGISTSSGISDFRSVNSGLWTKNNPMEVASLTVFQHEPERFFNWLHPLAKEIYSAIPNPGHLSLAKWEAAGLVKMTITQNIDHLHQGAGTKNILELHGSLSTASCVGCKNHYTAPQYLPKFVESTEIPRCPICGRILKPDIILFEELMPPVEWDSADNYSEICDLMIVIGSSLEVVPAATLPAKAARTGAQIIIMNRTPTRLDDQASVIIRDDLSILLPLLTERLL